jgi:2'-5' RNA ligase
MNLAIVAYPILDPDDRQWIETFRSKHDPQAARLGVHFTLVFPVVAVPSEVERELAMVARSTTRISFTIRGPEVVRDLVGSGSHVFLVPGEGGRQIAALHGRLYGGGLRVHRRADIPFVPHMTIGAAPNRQTGERLVAELGVGSRTVSGTIERLDLVDVGAAVVTTVATYALGAAAES